MGLNAKMNIGPYQLVCNGFTQDSNLNYNSEYAMLDVYQGGKKQFQMAPEKRVYLASEQPQTMVAIHSVPSWDLYVVYEGTNPGHGPADHQGVFESAGGLDLGRAGGDGVWHLCCADSEHQPGNGCVARSCCAGHADSAGAKGRSLMSGAGARFTFWVKAAQACLLAVAICFSVGASSNTDSRLSSLNHKLMCQCGCAQLLGECDHIGCPSRTPELAELSSDVSSGMSDQQILDSFAGEIWSHCAGRAYD